MRYLPLTPTDRAEMLQVIRAASVDDLFVDVPAAARKAAMTTAELAAHLLVDQVVPVKARYQSTLTAKASAVDPAGDEIEGELTTELIPGVGHTYTIIVSQPQVNPLRRKK